MFQQDKYISNHPKVPGKLTYRAAGQLARDEDAAVRKALAEHPDCPPEVLYYLAEDSDIGVRRAVACNENTPRKADLLLTADDNLNVRFDLATKIARVTPNLSDDTRKAVYQLTVDVLTALADDQIARVRSILADTIKDLPNAPHELVKKLALDGELSVAEPVLQFSPVLNDNDLIDIIYSDPIQGALAAISQRAAVSEKISEAIVSRGDSNAIRHLLENPKADIGEASMETILDRAPEQRDWHRPLTKRPRLSAKTVRRLASFVAMNLLDDMQKRLDLDDETLVVLAQAVEQRIVDDKGDEESEDGVNWQSEDAVLTHARELHKAGRLTADIIEEAFDENKRLFVIAAVAVLSGLGTEIIAETFGAQRPQRITAICWKAGVSPHFARLIQVQYGRVPPAKVIGPTEEGTFALAPKEMEDLLAAL